MATWTWPVVAGDAVEVEPRVLVSRLGDGYEQRVADGINTMLRRMSVRLVADHDTVDAAEVFLVARGAVEAFDWAGLDGVLRRWVCRKWSRSWRVDSSELSATFEEVVV